MMKHVYYITMALTATTFLACSEEVSVEVDAAFLPYLTIFEEEAASRSLDVSSRLELTSVSFLALGGESAGQCLTYSDGRKEVKINIEKWNSYSDLEKEVLLFHELGHCVLDREHDNETSNGRCISLMRESSRTCIVNYYGERRSAYLDELFK